MKNNKLIYGLLCISLLLACKNEKKEGYVIKGSLHDLPEHSIAVLSYTQKDTTITDSVTIKNGNFEFNGVVTSPAQAFISIRHGETFPVKSWNRDSFSFFIENTQITLIGKDSIYHANISGSLLNDETKTLDAQINPLRQKIQTLSRSLQGKPQDAAYMATVDTIKATGKKVETIAHHFIVNHPNSYLALRTFANYELGYNFDPNVAENQFNQFSDTIKQTPLADKVWKKIDLAKKTSVGQKAMNFTQETVDGISFSLTSLKGKYVLVDFWASWCVPCRMENPNVVKAYQEYKNQNFEIVGVSLDEKKKNWEAAIKKDGLPWIHVSDLKGWKNAVAQQYGISAVPQNLLIDPDGIIIAKNLRGEDLASKLSELFPSK
ncbi:thioredoxin-like domain-containing protein [Zhouia sp. PK063]|uniref:thioredoxin-like domain-containing protein n=1 Tax=Zhouia sp. PK063 TaxID=3373602 RepID=UPI003797B1E2